MTNRFEKSTVCYWFEDDLEELENSIKDFRKQLRAFKRLRETKRGFSERQLEDAHIHLGDVTEDLKTACESFIQSLVVSGYLQNL